ncbi:hypothetical protein EVAR_4258_1 [Eumeta japonica]|uniref:Uncharacterized protein n=1 Tax=Eumeta variegata TaxID=151549 RepID=A0A4C1Z9J2_EUMVA|nr:hypothetical protein EVAR_4258_1 [Eumeta japonica]
MNDTGQIVSTVLNLPTVQRKKPCYREDSSLKLDWPTDTEDIAAASGPSSGPIPISKYIEGVMPMSDGCVKRLTLLGRGNRKRQSESECVAIERMRVVYLLQASASVSNE